ncbi:MAG: hypothetical protein JO154_05545 [Chitinophaga sp.]|uniref:hypothetical protein n=1 Tax=Chitinophaga sp. TaxID=1869181 RepID=UPI0025BC9688|nr:hypothetical protein [Chitinophaga sp.]MBV8252052.1 hypothetical protein [Chitinophaga sp.]
METLQQLANEYLKNFDAGQKAMAASPKSLEYCVGLLEKFRPATVLDAGSGLSSLVFHAVHEKVTTIDDNGHWSEKTVGIIQSRLNKTIGITPLNDDIFAQRFDFTFYDYGDIETRIYCFKTILALTNDLIYLDDFHVGFYRDYIYSRAKRFTIIDLEEATKDEFGRYGAVLIKNPALKAAFGL